MPKIALALAVCVGFIIVFYLLRNKSASSVETSNAPQQQPANSAPSQQNQAASASPSAHPRSSAFEQSQLPPPSSTTATVPPTYAPKPVPVSAKAEIVTNPPGSEVVVDGRVSTTCNAPCTLELPAGRHTATASHDGYDVAHYIFTVPEEKNVNISCTSKKARW